MPFVTHDIPLLLLLLAIALLLGAACLVHFAARRASRLLPQADVEDGPLQSFRGGLRWPLPGRLGATNTPPVLVALDVYHWGVRIEARWPWLRPFVPSWCALYEEIRAAEHVRRVRMSKRGADGVRLRGALPGAPLIFWSSLSTRLLDSLEEHGVAVVRVAVVPRMWTNE